MMWLVMIVVLSVAFGSAFLIKGFVPDTHLGAWANVATIVGGIATAISLLWAAYTYYDTVRLQRELADAALYQEHQKESVRKMTTRALVAYASAGSRRRPPPCERC
jgi:hypothetical protein